MKTIVKVIYWVSITFLLLVAASIAHCQNTQYRQPSFADHPQNAVIHELKTGGGTAVASGEGHASIPTPAPSESMGDAARRLKKEHDQQPKAKSTYVN
jgi:hypothetical protein